MVLIMSWAMNCEKGGCWERASSVMRVDNCKIGPHEGKHIYI